MRLEFIDTQLLSADSIRETSYAHVKEMKLTLPRNSKLSRA